MTVLEACRAIIGPDADLIAENPELGLMWAVISARIEAKTTDSPEAREVLREYMAQLDEDNREYLAQLHEDNNS